MSTRLTVAGHLLILARHGEHLGVAAQAAGLAAAVPTCPGWTVHDLLEHLTMVHRWAAGQLIGEEVQGEQVTSSESLFDTYRAGLSALIRAIDLAPDSLQAMVFLLDAPNARQFWARRQAHETTIHYVDALAAALGRWPSATEAGIKIDAAVDGIDELLHGFIPRRRGRVRSDLPYTLAVEPTDAARRWLLAIGPEAVLTTEGHDRADETFTGTAAQLFLGLWNRGDEVLGSPPILQQWREQATVSWR